MNKIRTIMESGRMWFRTMAMIFCMVPFTLLAQAPVIHSLSKSYGSLNELIAISGSNFSDNPTDLYVYFGGARATIVSSTMNTIIVKVPGNATTGNVTVINKTLGLKAESRETFIFSFSGSGFDTSLLSAEFDLAETSELYDLCLCDFNNDARVDVATTKVTSATDLNVYKNNSTPGTLSFQKLSKITNSELDLLSTTSNLTCADLDGDGLKDLIATKSGNPRNVIFVLRNISTASTIKFAPAQSFFIPVEDIALKVLSKDLDKDGKAELIVTNTFDEYISIFKNSSTVGAISFISTPQVLNFPGAGTTAGLAVEDLNNDGYFDMAVNPYIAANLFVAVNQSTPGNISFMPAQNISITGNLNSIAWADYNGDGKTDLAVSKTIQNQVIVLINQTEEGSTSISFATPISVTTGSGPWGISSADMDGNGKSDILVGLRDSRAINLLRNSDTPGTASFTTVTINTDLFSRNIMGGDMDGDARPDFVYTAFDQPASKYNLSMIRNVNCFVPKIIPSGTQFICTGDTIRIESNQAYNATYRWDRNNVVVKDTTEYFYDVLQTGNYKVTAITDGGGCTKISNVVTFNADVGTAPTDVSIVNPGPICAGGDITLSTDPVTNGVYMWAGPGGFTASSQNISISGASGENAGAYTLQVKVGNCLSNKDTSFVEVTTMADFILSTTDPTTFCIGNNVDLIVNNISGYSYQWLKNNVSIPGATTNAYSANENGLYNVEITFTSLSCKDTTNGISLTSIAQPNAEYNISGSLCTGISLALDNISTFENSQPVEFTWNFGNDISGTSVGDTTYTYPSAGSFALTLVVAYRNGACRDSVTQQVIINTTPVCSITEDPAGILCAGISKTLTVTPAFDVYIWNTGEESQSIIIDSSAVYSVTVTDGSSCQATCEMDITFLPAPDITVTADPVIYKTGSEINLEATGALTYVWTPGNLLNDSTIANPVATNLISDSTYFYATGTNADGCAETDSVLVTLDQGNGINVKASKIFSPNGDGIDDNWVVQNIENYAGCTVSIYNGNGSIVFQSQPYNNNWNAVHNGKALQEGVYFFVIECDGLKSKTGSITVIR